jgi:thiol:disulfide interchange protein
LILLLVAASSWGQESHAKFSATLDPPDARKGEAARVLVRADVDPGWWIYGLVPQGDPTPLEIHMEPGSALAEAGKPVGPPAHKKFDKNFGSEVNYHQGNVIFALPVKVTGNPGDATAKVRIVWQVCDPSQCEPPSEETFDVSFKIAPGEPRSDHLAALTDVPPQPEQNPGQAAQGAKPGAGTDEFATAFNEARSKGLFGFILFAFITGLVALLTPCVFPMIPITVSFFSKRGDSAQKTNYTGAAAYCIGIITTFTGLGLAVTLIFGASGVQDLGANPWINLFLVLLFVALALSLFGVYELTLPSGLVNKMSSKSRTSTLLGPLLMGLTFTLTSFTCTVPFVGTILAGAAAGGDVLYPVLGMLAFSSAFALPFFFLALFPQLLAKLPKSGSWLATVKAFMGFIEVAAALKFLSNVDQVWETRFISEPIFLAIWASIAFFAAVYLFGWMRFPHDGAVQKIGWFRRVVAMGTLAAGVYCLAAIDGAPLGKLSAFLPPGKDKLEWIPSYESAKSLAQAQGRPLMIDFTGVTCTNCRDMEKNMFTRSAVNRELQQFVRAKLYTDRRNPEDKANKALLRELSKSVTLPVYVIQSPDGMTLKIFQGSTDDEQEFLRFLRQGREAFNPVGAKAVASRAAP